MRVVVLFQLSRILRLLLDFFSGILVGAFLEIF